ncbi:cytochrome P450 2J6-like [Acanthaster planci]|uniref:Cytochrome P450 2J6-like n=1 Tax=Acanthaster planci TaxID=133434 RepID=A0A8B7ZMN1_ACAPL|nr:cytochrome P450 2J6-like [Acanthaster planci]
MWFLDTRVILLMCSLLLVIRWLVSRRNKLPPGPWGFPFVGSIPSLLWGLRGGLGPHQIFRKYAATYGPVFHLRILNKTLVVLNDFAAIKEAFQNPHLNDRPKTLGTEVLKINGIAWTSGRPWIKLRRFCSTVLRSFGTGTSSFEDKIRREAEQLIREYGAFEGVPFDPKPKLGNAVANVICSVIFGKRYEYSDREFTRLQGLLGRNVELLGAGGAVNFFPGLRHLPFLAVDEVLSNSEEILNFLENIINSNDTAHGDGSSKFTDAYLGTNPARLSLADDCPQLRGRNIVGTISNLFAAGSETTSTTLQWALLYMVVYPKIQQRVQAEIDTVVGRNRLPCMADKSGLSFKQAVIWEVQRVSNILPLGVPHAAALDTHFRGFLIPKGAFIISNLWAAFHDPNIWPEPQEFNPQRFLDDNGKPKRPEEFIPFGIGRRVCIGDHLAKMELFLFFGYFMHQFTFKKEDNTPPLAMNGRAGITYSPVPFKVCAIPRD